MRRLKDALTNPDGTPRFPGRRTRPIDVDYTEDEQQTHALLQDYLAARRRVPGEGAVRAGDLISPLLGKRLFSSPAAFARTPAVHRKTVLRADEPQAPDDVPEWLADLLTDEDPDPLDDGADAERDPLRDEADAERDLLTRATTLIGGVSDRETELLQQLTRWAKKHAEAVDRRARPCSPSCMPSARPTGSSFSPIPRHPDLARRRAHRGRSRRAASSGCCTAASTPSSATI